MTPDEEIKSHVDFMERDRDSDLGFNFNIS